MKANGAQTPAVRASAWCAWAIVLALAALIALAAGRPASLVPPAKASVGGCDRYASPHGKNRWPGTRGRPFRTAQKLVRRLRRGQTGCLRRGTYRENVSMRRGGTRRRRLVLRAFPGERARVIGRFYVARRARYVTVRGLWLDGRNPKDLPSPTVNAHDVRFVLNDVTNRRTAICFLLGGDEYGHADRARIEQNRIHHCGQMPPTNFHHGVYVEAAKDVLIRGNWIHDNSDYGVHLYPNAQRTLVTGNVIHRNGEGVTFSGEGRDSSNGNRVERNVISGSLVRLNVESWWPDGTPVGVGNVLRRNCLFNRAGGAGILFPPLGFVAYDNLVAPPRFVDERRGDFRLRRGSRCRSVVPRRMSRVGP